MKQYKSNDVAYNLNDLESLLYKVFVENEPDSVVVSGADFGALILDGMNKISHARYLISRDNPSANYKESTYVVYY